MHKSLKPAASCSGAHVSRLAGRDDAQVIVFKENCFLSHLSQSRWQAAWGKPLGALAATFQQSYPQNSIPTEQQLKIKDLSSQPKVVWSLTAA